MWLTPLNGTCSFREISGITSNDTDVFIKRHLNENKAIIANVTSKLMVVRLVGVGMRLIGSYMGDHGAVVYCLMTLTHWKKLPIKKTVKKKAVKKTKVKKKRIT